MSFGIVGIKGGFWEMSGESQMSRPSMFCTIDRGR